MDNDFLKEVSSDVDTVFPGEEKLSRLTALARTQLAIEKEIEELDQKILDRKAQLEKVSHQEIPSLMHEIGAKEITLLTGQRLKITPFFTGKITDNSAYDWLEENGHGDIVKNHFSVNIRLSETEQIEKVRRVLHDAGIDWNEEQGVHHSTLKAWIKETVQSGQYIDRQLFNVYTGFKTTIK